MGLQRSDIKLLISAQAVEGTIDTNPVFTEIRKTGGSLVSAPTYVTGNEIPTDGNAPQQVQDRRETSMSVDFDMSQETAKYFEALIHGAQTDNGQAASTGIEATATGYVMPAGHVSGLSVGDWFGILGSTNADLDTAYKVASIDSATEITTSQAPAATEAAGASIVMSSLKCSNGTQRTVLTTQQRVLDNSKVGNIAYKTVKDTLMDTGSISIEKSGIVTGSFGAKMGNPEAGTAAIAGQTDATVDTSDSVSAINNTKMLYVDGQNIGCVLSTMGIEFANNFVGDEGGAGGCTEEFGRGVISLSGSLIAKTFADSSTQWADRRDNGTRVALAAHMTWPDDRWMVIEITRAVVTEHSFTDGEIVENEMSYTAEGDATTGATIQIFRNWV